MHQETSLCATNAANQQINSLWPSDAIWQQWFWSTLVQAIWLVSWRHQTITCFNFDLSSLCSNDVHLTVISLEISQPSVIKIRNSFENYFSMTLLKQLGVRGPKYQRDEVLSQPEYQIVTKKDPKRVARYENFTNFTQRVAPNETVIPNRSMFDFWITNWWVYPRWKKGV